MNPAQLMLVALPGPEGPLLRLAAPVLDLHQLAVLERLRELWGERYPPAALPLISGVPADIRALRLYPNGYLLRTEELGAVHEAGKSIMLPQWELFA